jgi:hypothetical protein
MTDNSKPNPGSDAAILLGCRCPIFDNASGKGYLGLGKRFWINEDCLVHTSKK